MIMKGNRLLITVQKNLSMNNRRFATLNFLTMKNFVCLLRDPDERTSLAQLLQFG